MATSKKPRKKHDKNANIKRQSDRICRNSLVLSVIGLGNNGTEWIKNNIPQDRKTATTAKPLVPVLPVIDLKQRER